MISTLVLFGVSAAAIYLACEYFVNGVEWLGHRLGLAETATGTILAALGTALPESAVTFVAVVFGRDEAARDIGVGAALGGPLVLATLAYPLVGWAVLVRRRRARHASLTLNCDTRRLSRDQGWFLAIFSAKLALGVLAFAIKPWLGALFVLAYGGYLRSEMRRPGATAIAEELEPLKLRPRRQVHWGWALAQTLAAVAVIGIASRVFVDQLEGIGAWLGLSSQLVALLLSPVATEMPEMLNALIWVRQGRERLALANLSGAMMVQATIPTALGLFFTPWLFSTDLVAAGVVTALTTLALFLMFRAGRPDARRLAGFALFYGAFAAIAWVL